MLSNRGMRLDGSESECDMLDMTGRWWWEAEMARNEAGIAGSRLEALGDVRVHVESSLNRDWQVLPRRREQVGVWSSQHDDDSVRQG